MSVLGKRQKALLRLAAFLILFTCVGHTFGTFASVPADEVQRAQIFAQMQNKIISMPGAPLRSYGDFLLGADICLIIYLFITGLVFILESRDRNANNNRATLYFHCAGLALTSAASFLFFFPVPAVCLGLAAVLGLVAAKR